MWQHLRAWRKLTGKTLVEVAKALGTTHSTVLRYERGEMKVPNEVIDQLAKLYGCVPAELQHDPAKREVGRRIHDAIELLHSLDPQAAERWLEIGRLLNKRD